MKKIAWFVFLISLFIALTHPFFLGLAFEPWLENKLTDLFGMRVTIERLRANLITGDVHAARIRFMNPPGFSDGPHLDDEGISFRINYWEIKHNHVQIGTIHLKKPYYYIERIPKDKSGGTNNVITWWRHIKAKVQGPDNGKEDNGPSWRIEIQKIEIEDGIFIFRDKIRPAVEKKYYFGHLDGFLEDFRRPNSPDIFNQTLKMKGTFGEQNPAPFWIEGPANFATSDVGFDLHGEIPVGKVVEHHMFWGDLPIEIVEGNFQLKAHAECHRSRLKSRNVVILDSLKVKPRSSADAIVWGLPMMASINFLQEQKKIYLKVPVHGDIGDPEFEFASAFRKAFQESLARRTAGGIEILKRGSSKIASQTKGLVKEAPTKIVDGLGKISNAVTNTVASNIPPVIKNHNGKKKE